MLKTYRVGIIGCGHIGIELPDNHKLAYESCLQTKLVALCDDKKDIPNAYKNYMEMVEKEHLDIVSVCTPPETHCQIVCDIVHHVKAIYCEKPIALTLLEAREMINTCHNHNVILQINHQRRFRPPVFRFSRGIMNTGSHMFDLLRHLFGELEYLTWEYAFFKSGLICRIEEIDTQEPVFELDCTHNKDRMIGLGVQHLVRCLETGMESRSSGEEAYEDLRLCLTYKKLKEEGLNAKIWSSHN